MKPIKYVRMLIRPTLVSSAVRMALGLYPLPRLLIAVREQ